MNPVKRSLYSLHFAVVLLGFTALFAKIIPLSATDITFGRSLIAGFSLLVLVKLTGGRLRLNRPKDYLVAFMLGAIMAAHWVSYFAAMQYSSVSVGMIALFTFPVITVFLEPFFEKTRLQWRDVGSAVVVFVGIFLIVPDISLQNHVTVGIGIGIFSACLYAFRNLLHRKYFSQYSGAHAMAYQTLVIAILLVWFISPNLTSASWPVWGWVILLGTLCTAAPHAMVAASLQHLRAKTFSLVACMQPIYGVVLAILLIDEKPDWHTIVGGLLVISAAIYETVTTHRQHAS